MSAIRRSIWLNEEWQSYTSARNESVQHAYRFHKTLPNYRPTPLRELQDLACEIGVKAIYLKDEGDRLGLPSFKILGASWGTFRALAARLPFSLDSTLDSVKALLRESNITLYAATEGNHGRAVARAGFWLGLQVIIYVPSHMHAATIRLIESEGARVCKSSGDYDEAVLEAERASRQDGGLLIQDFAFGDYIDIPQWIVDGYQTMMSEIDGQLALQQPTHVFAPIGVGSLASAIAIHFRRPGKVARVIGVEPDTAACMHKSLEAGHMTTIRTTPTIMAGLNCGTVSSTAWTILSKGLSASVTVSDIEAHAACEYLQTQGISAGPCGASPVAALRSLSASDKIELGIDGDSIIVLPCTEGPRSYEIPF